MDFILKTYRVLLHSLRQHGFSFQSFEKYLETPGQITVILRHDVDLQPQRALNIARFENNIGIICSYYFRYVPQSFDENIIKQISELGHEIGYHYENLVTCKGDFECAIKDFEKNLERFRKIVPVKTICMHGSPLSQWNSRKLWEKYNYRNYDIIGEPYIDIDYTKVLYLTDTGRRWDGEKYRVRDKVLRSDRFNQESMGAENKNLKNNKNTALLSDKYKFRSTFDIIRAAEKGELPDKIMINMHPQRWNDKPLLWLKEYVGQNVKNIVKRVFFVK